MGRKVGKNFYFKKKFCPIFYFMTHLFPTAQLKNRGVEAQGHKFFYIIFYLYVLLNQITGNNNKFLLGLIWKLDIYSKLIYSWAASRQVALLCKWDTKLFISESWCPKGSDKWTPLRKKHFRKLDTLARGLSNYVKLLIKRSSMLRSRG